MSVLEKILNFGKRFSKSMLKMPLALTAAACFSLIPVSKADEEKFSFVVIGDSRDGYAIYEEMIPNILNTNLDFVIHTGDMVNIGKNPEEWVEFALASKPLLEHPINPPLACFVYPTIGNHELWDDFNLRNLKNYFELFNKPPINNLYYSFDYKNSHFISLFMPDEFTYPIDIEEGSEMHSWLENDFKVANENPQIKWKFAFFHAPIFSNTEMHGCTEKIQKAVVPLLNQYKVDAVFNGHSHAYQRYGPLKFFKPDLDGITYIISAGLGSFLYQFNRADANSDLEGNPCDAWNGEHKPVNLTFGKVDYHYVKIDVGEKNIFGTAYYRNGEVMEEFVIRGQRQFRRGDINGDGRLNIADAICQLSYLFNPKEELCNGLVSKCFDAADSNDDAGVNIADPITTLTYLFGSGKPLPKPFQNCGIEETTDNLTCDSYNFCR